MKTYVISLVTEVQRREHATKQLRDQNIEFSFYDAQRVEASCPTLFKRYDEKEFLLNTGRHSTLGEIGCYASHKAMWSLAVETNEPIMIMEDDFSLASDFHKLHELTASLIDQYGFIRLQNERREKSRLVQTIDSYSLVYYTKMPHSLMCYAVSPSMAKQLLAHADVFDAPVDVMIKKIWEHKQRLYGLSPYPVDRSDFSSVSTINGRKKHKKPVLISLNRFTRKCLWAIKRELFTLFFQPPIRK